MVPEVILKETLALVGPSVATTLTSGEPANSSEAFTISALPSTLNVSADSLKRHAHGFSNTFSEASR